MGLKVRRATELDVDWILSELQKFSQFYGTKKSLFGDEEYARSAFSNLLENHLVLVAEKESLCGFVAGYFTPHPFNPEIKVLSETFWWVPEEHRGTRAGALLLDEFVKHGEEIADWITFTLEHRSPVNDRCLTKRGFRLQERQYLKEVG